MHKLNNKKAASKWLSPWLFLVLIVIGAGIVLGVWAFYSVGIDIRFEEAKTISNKLVLGVVENGYLINKVSEENILDLAGFDKKKFERDGKFYFNIIIGGDSISKGNQDFEIQCQLPGESMAICYEEELIVLGENNELIKIKILSGSNQLGSKL